jgi:hypothetical protein
MKNQANEQTQARKVKEYVSATALSRLRFADDHPEDFSSSSRRPCPMKKYRSGPQPPDAPLQVPGRSVQLDVKFVPRVGRAGQRFYQFTVIDEATRFRVLRIYECYALVSDLGPDNLPGDDDFDAAVLLTTLSCAVVGHWVVHTKAFRR